MRTALKWVGVLLAGLIGLAIIGIAIFYFLAEARLTTRYEIEIQPVSIPEQVPPVEEVGFPLVAVSICEECHGEDMAGQIMQDDPLSARLIAPNLTTGDGGLESSYTFSDFVRAIRHGVGRDSEPLLILPSVEMGKFCDSDLAMIFAYVNSLPPVDNVLPKSELGPLGRAMLVAGLLPPEMIPAEMIDHSAPSCFESPADGTLEFGEYLASFCSACHGQDFSGSPNPLGEEFTQSPMNLTPGGVMGDWSEAEFINTLRTGIAPDDYKLDPEEMPWQTIAKATDSQLKALWRYLQILPPVETEHR